MAIPAAVAVAIAGTGRKREAGTAFGSRWTDAGRGQLQALLHEHGRREAARLLVEASPHCTAQGALYQIDRNLSKRAS